MNQNTIFDVSQIGRLMLTESVLSSLEAFSGNALYCGRGMPTMNKYKTVKEVCALTGLTRKHLYYFHRLSRHLFRTLSTRQLNLHNENSLTL